MRAIKAAKRTTELVEVREMFLPVDIRSLDSKRRITLSGRLQKLMMSKMKIDSYKVMVGKNGDILLRPTVSVPSNEAWLYHNQKAIGKVRQGLKEASEGKAGKVDDLESFLNEL